MATQLGFSTKRELFYIMRPARNNIFILRIACVCVLLTLYACKTTDKSHRGKAKKELIVPLVADNAANELFDHRVWQREQVARIDSVLSGYIDWEEALYARSDTAFSVFIPAGNLFKPHSSTPVKPDAAALLNRFERFMADNSGLSLLIAGHESAGKNDGYNQHLSSKRAKNLLHLFNELCDNKGEASVAFFGYGSSYLNTLNDFDYNHLIEFRFIPCK